MKEPTDNDEEASNWQNHRDWEEASRSDPLGENDGYGQVIADAVLPLFKDMRSIESPW